MQDLESKVGKLQKAFSVCSEEIRLAFRYIESDPSSSLTKSRIVMEKLLIRIYKREMEREPKKPLLGDILADNQFTRKLDRRLISRMNSIRDMANLGSHGEIVEPSDALRVLDDLCVILDWYLQRYENEDLPITATPLGPIDQATAPSPGPPTAAQAPAPPKVRPLALSWLVASTILVPLGAAAFVWSVLLFDAAQREHSQRTWQNIQIAQQLNEPIPYIPPSSVYPYQLGVAVVVAGIALELVALIIVALWLHRAWSCVYRKGLDPRPWAAVGLLFLPLFNLYWIFRAIPGLSAALLRELNERASAQRHNAGRRMGIAACVVVLIPYVNLLAPVLFFIWLYVANAALNRLVQGQCAPTSAPKGTVTLPGT